MNDPDADARTEAVLKHRAEQLARRAADEESGQSVEVIICRLGNERYAVETSVLRAVHWPSGATPVPSTPSYVLGLVSIRGEIITLLDLAAMLGLPGTASAAEAGTRPALLVGLPGVRAGLVVDEVLGVEQLRLDSLEPALSGREFARGVAPGPTVLLDVELLLKSGRFDVDDSAF
jgi:purine-binding chemotaxis protein CheW